MASFERFKTNELLGPRQLVVMRIAHAVALVALVGGFAWFTTLLH
jgi:hypothetical protein